MYLLAIFLPPVAVLLCGKPVQAVLNCFLTLCFLIPGSIHACMVVGSHQADLRTKRVIRAQHRDTNRVIRAQHHDTNVLKANYQQYTQQTQRGGGDTRRIGKIVVGVVVIVILAAMQAATRP